MVFPNSMPRGVRTCPICGEEMLSIDGMPPVCYECTLLDTRTPGQPSERCRQEMERQRKKRKKEHKAKLARKHARSVIEKMPDFLVPLILL